jgi:hypothetical protein
VSLGLTGLSFALVSASLSAQLPYWLLPALPAALYAVLVLVLEPRRLGAELRYLREVLAHHA